MGTGNQKMSENKPYQDIFTPNVLIDELFDYIPIRTGDVCLEPSAGNGNMVKHIVDRGDGLKVVAVEIQIQHCRDMVVRLKDNNNINKITIQRPEINVMDIFF